MGLYKGSRTQPSTQALMQDMMSPKNSFNPAEMATLAPGKRFFLPFVVAWRKGEIKYKKQKKPREEEERVVK